MTIHEDILHSVPRMHTNIEFYVSITQCESGRYSAMICCFNAGPLGITSGEYISPSESYFSLLEQFDIDETYIASILYPNAEW